MVKVLIMQFLTLSIYVLFMGICFCDGFRLHLITKLIWFLAFLFISIYVLKSTNQFDLTLILPVPTLLAILFCRYELKNSRAKRRADTDSTLG
jgi:hypothetical protein